MNNADINFRIQQKFKTIGNYLAQAKPDKVDAGQAECKQVESKVKQLLDKLMSAKGTRTVDSFHRELGKLVWENCGMSRSAAGLQAARGKIAELREQYWAEVKLPGSGEQLNQSLEKAVRVADFFELGELMCLDAQERDESCGAHFREEHQTDDGEAKRNDADYSFVSVWENSGDPSTPRLHKEPLTFEYVMPTTRSYK